MKRIQDLLSPAPRRASAMPQLTPTAHVTPAGMPMRSVVDGFEVLAKSAAEGVGHSLGMLLRGGPGAALVRAAQNLYGENDNARFHAQNEPFRQDIRTVRAAKQALDASAPGAPEYPALKAAFEAADQQLANRSGYRLATLPPEGTLFVDPQNQGGRFPDGQVHASTFPTQTARSTPPSALDALFDSHTPVRLEDAAGKIVNVPNREAYTAIVLANRARAQMPRQGGEAIAVHVAFEGGGGKGKRYAPALSEMMQLGVVPASVTGSSVGAIAAAVTAAGAKPADLADIVNSPEIAEFQDADLRDGGGLFDGDVAFAFYERKLAELTGITDRPVTFADLKIPCQIIATIMGDTDPAEGQEDLTRRANRTFVFSQETTPNTSVALAVRASTAIPGVFNPVQMVDPTTGRQLALLDGAVLDSLPMAQGHKTLPQLGLTLHEPNSNHPNSNANSRPERPLRGRSVDSRWTPVNALYGFSHNRRSSPDADDFQDRTRPTAGRFMLALPVWDLTDPARADKTLEFPVDPDLDPKLDVQTRAVTREYLRQVIATLDDPTASATNTVGEVPQNTDFTRTVQMDGKSYTATYLGGDKVHFDGADGEHFEVKLGRQNIEAMILDDLTFGDLPVKIAWQVAESRKPFWEKIHLPF